MIKQAKDLNVGDLIVGLDNGKGTCEVLTLPTAPAANGRVSFEGRDEKGRVNTNYAQAAMELEVQS